MRRIDVSPVLWGATFGVIATVLLWSRIGGLDLSFWHDEVVTVIRYAGQGPRAIFFGEYIPNNHVLFENLAWGTTRILGQSEVIYRLWAVVPFLTATVWLTWWMCRRFGYLAGAALLLLMTVSPLLLQLSREARGYGLAMFAMAGLITQADAALEVPESGAVWRFALFGAIGTLTLPVFVLPYVFAALPLLIEPRLRWRLISGLGVTGILALAWFSPMLGGILENSSQQFGAPVPWYGFVTLSMSQLVFPIYRLLMSGNPDILLSNPRDPMALTLIWHSISWLLLSIGGFWLWRRNLRRLLGALALPTFGTYLVLATLGMWTADRFVSYLSIPLFVLLALGVHGVADGITLRARPAAILALAGLASWLIISFYPVADYVVQVPHEALSDAAQLANESTADLVVTNSVRPQGFQYYLSSPPQIMTPEDLEHLFCTEGTVYVFLEHPFKAEELDTSCLEMKKASRIRLYQRGRGRHIDVWFVGLPAVELKPR